MKHFLLIEYCTIVVGLSDYFESDIDWSNPPVLPIGAINIETSMQLGVNNNEPVHKHLPFKHWPFLLQW